MLKSYRLFYYMFYVLVTDGWTKFPWKYTTGFTVVAARQFYLPSHLHNRLFRFKSWAVILLENLLETNLDDHMVSSSLTSYLRSFFCSNQETSPTTTLTEKYVLLVAV